MAKFRITRGAIPRGVARKKVKQYNPWRHESITTITILMWAVDTSVCATINHQHWCFQQKHQCCKS